METYFLYRRYFDFGTFGAITTQAGDELCKTVERAWLNNARGKSCIPEGEYLLKPHVSPKFGECYLLEAPSLGVTHSGPSLRTHILIHSANTPEQLEGCIAPGLRFGTVNQVWGVLESKVAFDQLMKALNGKVAKLVITNAHMSH